ncbi:HigA family addiction module antitoxin [Amycolatopsis sp. lyj-112]|uniref:HigA family addiction module antitoxin n=1 Tax=Amycolatopsis sp. lyj-112 TaxID=2789288 RepID=UPI003977F1B1
MTSPAGSYPYRPETPPHPGEILKEQLDEQRVSQADLARRAGLSTKHVNQIVQGVVSLSPDIAVRLERATGVSAETWNQLEAVYQTHQSALEDERKLAGEIGWVGKFPLAFLAQMGVLRDTGQSLANLQRLLSFFGVATPDVAEQAWREYRLAFRRSELVEGDGYSIATWLRVCEVRARNIECEPFSRERLIASIPEMRNLTLQQPALWQVELPRLCASLGVSLVFIPALKNTHLSGVTRWLASDKVMIGLSDRFKTDDTFWFSFFHELAHVLLHGKRLTFLDHGKEPGDDGEVDSSPIFLHGDSKVPGASSESEREADKFAQNSLIPEQKLQKFLSLPAAVTEQAIRTFADDVGVAPSVVVGRLQHEKIVPWSFARKLKTVVRFNSN